MITLTLSQDLIRTALEILPLPSGTADLPMVTLGWEVRKLTPILTRQQFHIEGAVHVTSVRSLISIDTLVPFVADMAVSVQETAVALSCQDLSIGTLPLVKDVLGSFLKPRLSFTLPIPEIPILTLPLGGDQSVDIQPLVTLGDVAIQDGALVLTGIVHVGIPRTDPPHLFRIRGALTVSAS